MEHVQTVSEWMGWIHHTSRTLQINSGKKLLAQYLSLAFVEPLFRGISALLHSGWVPEYVVIWPLLSIKQYGWCCRIVGIRSMFWCSRIPRIEEAHCQHLNSGTLQISFYGTKESWKFKWRLFFLETQKKASLSVARTLFETPRLLNGGRNYSQWTSIHYRR